MAAEREARLLAAQESGDDPHDFKAAGFRAWVKDSGKAIRENWVLFIYMVILMAGFNACSHGSQDFYPTFLKNRTFSPHCLPVLYLANDADRS